MRKRGYLILVGLVVFFLIILNLPQSAVRLMRSVSREGAAPYQDLAVSSAQKGRLWLRAFRNIDDVVAANGRLQADLAKLRVESDRQRALVRENGELRALLGFVQQSPYRLVPCEVVARGDVTGWWQTLRLNKGEAEGIATNLAVITSEGLVGRTVQVSRHTCDVLLVTDPDCRVSCRLSRINAFGVVRGRGVSVSGTPLMEVLCPPELFQMDYVSKEAAILAGDEVVTSGLGGVFPRDLLVGYVEKVYMDPSGLYQHADLVPAVNLSALRRVFVVLE